MVNYLSEDTQIKLIGLEFNSIGMDVKTNFNLGRNGSIDIYAYKGDVNNPTEFVVVLFLNRSNRSFEKVQRLGEVFARALRSKPHGRLEFRYLDVAEADAKRRRIYDINNPEGDFYESLRRLSNLSPSRVTTVALSDWWLFIRMARYLGIQNNIPQEAAATDLLETLAHLGFLPQKVDEGDISYVRLVNSIESALEGGYINFDTAKLMRELIIHLRKKVFKYVSAPKKPIMRRIIDTPPEGGFTS